MIIWGGYDNNGVELKTGGRYNSNSDSWTPTSVSTGAPVQREQHTAVWTGNGMIIWAGITAPPAALLNTGGRYNPVLDTWMPTSTGANVPIIREWHTAVWSGNEMIIWGGNPLGASSADTNTGGRYNPASDSWLPTSTGVNTPSARSNHTAVWTGNEVIIWGGFSDPNLFNTGGRYNPSTDSWSATSIDANVPSGRLNHTAVWIGGAMIVWGGDDNTGGVYSLNTIPGPGNSLRGSKSPGATMFNWGPVYGAGSYNVKRCSGAAIGCVPSTIVSTPTIPQYSEANDPSSYFYAIEAVNICGASP